MLTLGVDGCPSGWFAVGAYHAAGCREGEGLSLFWESHPKVGDLLASPSFARAGLALIDMPIGLSDGPPRPCDGAARRRLGPRRGSVFSPPMRAMLAMKDRAAASRYGQGVRRGGGVSAQAWNIAPKIAELDLAMTPGLQGRLREGHPELAFARLGGGPMAASKKTEDGRAARIALLRDVGADPGTILDEVRRLRPRPAAADDVLDACVLAVAARDALEGRAWVLGGEEDAAGLRMEVLG